MSADAAPDTSPVIGLDRVLLHEHDEEVGVFKIVVARQLIQPESMIEVPVLDADGQVEFEGLDDELRVKTAPEVIPAVVLGYVGVEDYVFAADDERWFDADGNRRPDDEIAVEQRQIIKEARDKIAAETAVEQAPPRSLPGVGEEL